MFGDPAGGWARPSWAKPERRLTQDELLQALYVCSPSGLAQLTEVLSRRDVKFTGDELQSEIGTGLKSGKVEIQQVHIGTDTVVLYGLRGCK